MKKHFLIVIVAALSLNLISCRSSQKAPKTDATLAQDPTLPRSMQGLKQDMSDLLPYLVNPKKFRDPANSKVIRQKIDSLQSVSAHVTRSAAMQAQDPTLNFLSNGFEDELKDVREAFDQGHRDYARGALLNISSYCIECHTRTNSGPDFKTPVVDQELKSLSPLDRGEYLLAVRQFEPALAEFDSIIKTGIRPGSNVFDLERATRLALSITVRYKADPKASRKIVEDLLKAPNLPFALKATAQAWRKSILSWGKETALGKRDVLKFSQELVHDSKRIQKGSADERAGDIPLMRVQGLLNPLVSTEKDPARLGQTLYLLGAAYEAVKDMAMWDLSDSYYESCIRQVPHTEWSEQCYKRYRESVLLGYTGSAGTSVPPDVESKMGELHDLSVYPAPAAVPAGSPSVTPAPAS